MSFGYFFWFDFFFPFSSFILLQHTIFPRAHLSLVSELFSTEVTGKANMQY